MRETNRHAIDLGQRPKAQVVEVLTWLAGATYHPVSSWLVEVDEGKPRFRECLTSPDHA
ncbi:MAG: hypothetical protein JWR37_3466 [Mycobacterium sp.]|jgi:hypothetical protein|nr:hypothetical protein [Mycobacterium sp.]